MRGWWIACVAVLGTVFAQDDRDRLVDEIFRNSKNNNGTFLPPDYEIITKKPLESLSALSKCGEGEELNKKVCVPYHNCDPVTNTVVEDTQNFGEGVIDIRQGGNCDNYLDVCCNLPEGGVLPPVTKKPDVTPTPPKQNFCGIRNPNGIDFKITGNTQNEAEYGEFPWMIAVLTKSDDFAVCGGSLITPNVVLTGAHCVFNLKPSDIRIRAGEWDTQTTNERLPHQDIDVQNIIVHEEFSPKVVFNDVALLILKEPVLKADNVGTICLPPQGQTYYSKNCFASGWGKTKFGAENVYSIILKKIELPVIQKQNCQDALRKTRLGKHFVLHDSFICAGGEAGKDTCTGDGGSPLVCPDPINPNRYLQVGIVAWGIGCGENNVPGVYAEVSKFRDWVDQQLKRLSIETSPYIL